MFKETQAFLSEILRDAKYSEESYWKFTDTCQRARFLFKPDIHSHLIEIRNRAGKMRMYQKESDGLEPGTSRSALIDKQYVELEWLNDQLDPLFDRFNPYLSFNEIS